MLSPFSSLEAYGGAIFSPRLPSHIFPSEEDRAAAMDDAPYDDMEEQYDDDGDDSDDDGSPNDAGGFPPRVKDWKDVDYVNRPLVTVDRARRDVFSTNSFWNTNSYATCLITLTRIGRAVTILSTKL